jgi:hypothetical protein
MSESEANALKRRFSPVLMNIPGVCGVGVERSDGDFVVVVHLGVNDPAIRKRLPTDLDGQRYKVIVSGPYTKF